MFHQAAVGPLPSLSPDPQTPPPSADSPFPVSIPLSGSSTLAPFPGAQCTFAPTHPQPSFPAEKVIKKKIDKKEKDRQASKKYRAKKKDEVKTLQERNMVLENRFARVEAERDTYRRMVEDMTAKLGVLMQQVSSQLAIPTRNHMPVSSQLMPQAAPLFHNTPAHGHMYSFLFLLILVIPAIMLPGSARGNGVGHVSSAVPHYDSPLFAKSSLDISLNAAHAVSIESVNGNSNQMREQALALHGTQAGMSRSMVAPSSVSSKSHNVPVSVGAVNGLSNTITYRDEAEFEDALDKQAALLENFCLAYLNTRQVYVSADTNNLTVI